MIKTNAIRLLTQEKIDFRTIEYEVDEDNLDGIHTANQIGLPTGQVFKTLVAKGDKKGIAVFCIPVDRELDLKKAAKVIGDKKIEMLPVKELLNTTGYIRGGCSPIGMKKRYPTFIDESALIFDEISVSAGVRGCQIVINPKDLIQYILGVTSDLI